MLRPILYILYFLSGFYSRDSKLWVFGSWSGERLSDNGAALFRYSANSQASSIKPVWISPSKAVVQKVRDEGLTAHHPWSPRGILICLKAGVYVFDVCGKDINYWLSRGARNVLLRHGTGIKKIGRAIDNPSHHLFRLFHGNWIERHVLRFFLPWHNTELDLVIASSKQHAEQARDFFVIKQDNIVITGSPRNDILFSSEATVVEDEAASWIDNSHREGKQVFIYMPTFRDDRRPAFPHSWKKLDSLAGRLGIRILVRLHPVDAAIPSPTQLKQFENLFLHDKNADPYYLFSKIDCLITDYSSVVYDYMLLHRPIIFFCPDLDEFLRNSRSFYFDYLDVTPGPKPRTLEELENTMIKIISSDPETTPLNEAYEKTLRNFHKFQDGHSSERVYQEIFQRFCKGTSEQVMIRT